MFKRFDKEEGIDHKKISYVEEQLKIKFPKPYVQYILDQADFEKRDYKITLVDRKFKHELTITFLGFDESKPDNILKVFNDDYILEMNHFIPFAKTEWEFDYICFYFENGINQEPKIIYYNYDLFVCEDEFDVLTDSFTEFVEILNTNRIYLLS